MMLGPLGRTLDREAHGFKGGLRAQVLAGALLSLGLLSGSTPVLAQDAQASAEVEALRAQLDREGYVEPTAALRDAVLAPRWQNIGLTNLDPTGQRFVHTQSDGPPTLDSFAREHLNLGALQIDPVANRHRTLSTRSDVGYRLISTRDGSGVDVEVPSGARVSGATWSPDGSQLAFFANFDDATHLYVADAASGRSRRVSRDPLLAVHVRTPIWTGNGNEVVVVLSPADRGAMPQEPPVPPTPQVRHTTDEKNALRTYFDLLESPYEKELVRWFSRGQLAVIGVDNRQVTRIGAPQMISAVDASPEGDLFRVTYLSGELSYIVPTMDSGTREELWDRDGRMLALITEEAADEGADTDDDEDEARRTGLTWHPTEPGLVFIRQAARDTNQVVLWQAPFDEGSEQVLYQSSERMRAVMFDAAGQTLFVTRGQMSWNGDGSASVHAVRLAQPDTAFLISRRSADSPSDDPGELLTRHNERGLEVVRTSADGGSVYLSGVEYFDDPLSQAPRPFVDRLAFESGDKERLFQSSAERYEVVQAALDDAMTEMLVERQSRTAVPQLIRVNLASGDEAQITENVDFTPELTATRREVFMISRPDGFTSKVEVTLPPGWREGDAAPPALFWFYPREYTEQSQYDARNIARYNRNAFLNLRPRSMEIMALSGYAVVAPDLPIVGEQGQMNDNYVQDLRNTLSAVIDSLSARGFADRARLALGGHSYGAFGTVNAMVHTPFFKAGIAGDGNYNRSLTPAGFQSERRMLWESEQIYIEMSPFFVADRLTGSLLMYHGLDDHNVGTHPDHSRRLFHALNVLGKDASLYMYPFEDHGPATEETLLDLWGRWSAWLDLHVKGEPQRVPVS
jgi:dipeptidyl aminopeptidase/acylaminoacyl peptidase